MNVMICLHEWIKLLVCNKYHLHIKPETQFRINEVDSLLGGEWIKQIGNYEKGTVA